MKPLSWRRRAPKSAWRIQPYHEYAGHVESAGSARNGGAKRSRRFIPILARRGYPNPGDLKSHADESAAYRQAMQQTEQMAIELQQTDGARLQGVMFGQGGSGPEIGRTVKALCSTQMNERSREFAARGIEPRIIPAARASGQQVIAAIRTLPMAIRDAVDKVVAVIGAMRIALTQAARAALVSGQAVLSAALNTVEAALVRAGSRFSTPIIVINMRELKRAAGIFDPDDGA